MTLEGFSTEELQAEVERREQKNELNLLRQKGSFTDEDRLLAFERLYDFVFNGMEEMVKNGREPKDFRYYVYEEAMMTLLGKHVFDLINEYIQ